MVYASVLLLFPRSDKAISLYLFGIPRSKALETHLPVVSLKLKTAWTKTKAKGISQNLKP